MIELETRDGEPRETWIDNAKQVLAPYQGNGKFLIDLGAHVGTVSILAVKEYGFTKCIAVEADLENFAHMLDNIAMNDCEGYILPIWAAITPDPPLSHRFLHSNTLSNSGTHSIVNQGSGFRNLSQSVMSLRLTNLYNINGYPDFLKVDIEGMEWKIFNQLHSEYLDIELHPKIDFTKSAETVLRKRYDLQERGDPSALYGYKRVI